MGEQRQSIKKYLLFIQMCPMCCVMFCFSAGLSSPVWGFNFMLAGVCLLRRRGRRQGQGLNCISHVMISLEMDHDKNERLGQCSSGLIGAFQSSMRCCYCCCFRPPLLCSPWCPWTWILLNFPLSCRPLFPPVRLSFSACVYPFFSSMRIVTCRGK